MGDVQDEPSILHADHAVGSLIYGCIPSTYWNWPYGYVCSSSKVKSRRWRDMKALRGTAIKTERGRRKRETKKSRGRENEPNVWRRESWNSKSKRSRSL